MAIAIVQWTTGNVGQAVGPRRRRPPRARAGRLLRLVATTRSASTSASSAASMTVGVAATNDVDALLALKPDCVVYNPMWPDTDEVVRILEAGVNVVSTAAFINGKRNPARPRAHPRRLQARWRRRSSAPASAPASSS